MKGGTQGKECSRIEEVQVVRFPQEVRLYFELMVLFVKAQLEERAGNEIQLRVPVRDSADVRSVDGCDQ